MTYPGAGIDGGRDQLGTHHVFLHVGVQVGAGRRAVAVEHVPLLR